MRHTQYVVEENERVIHTHTQCVVEELTFF